MRYLKHVKELCGVDVNRQILVTAGNKRLRSYVEFGGLWTPYRIFDLFPATQHDVDLTAIICVMTNTECWSQVNSELSWLQFVSKNFSNKSAKMK